MNELKKWLTQNQVTMDNLGRIVIKDEQVLSEINGAVGLAYQEMPEIGCGAGCDAGCNGCVSEGY